MPQLPRFPQIYITINDEVITIANVYAATQSEPRDQLTFMSELEERLAGLEIQTLYIGGDLNTKLTPNNTATDQDSASSASNGANYRSLICSIMTDYSLMDVWHSKNPKSTRGSFQRGSYSARLDYLLIPQHLQNPETKVDILPYHLSDHSLIILEVGLLSNQRGPGHWKFDNNLLHDPAFQDKLLDRIRLAMEEEFTNPNTRWEWLKFKIRQFSMEYKSSKNREHKKEVKALQYRLQLLAVNNDPHGSPI